MPAASVAEVVTSRSSKVISGPVNAIFGDASGAVRLSMVSQRTRQLRMQKNAIRLASRSAVRNFESSALQPDFKILWKTSTSTAWRTIDLLDRLGASANGQVRD